MEYGLNNHIDETGHLMKHLKSVGEFTEDGAWYRIENPYTGRIIYIPAADLPGILDLIPKPFPTGEGDRQRLWDVILAARKNYRTLSQIQKREDGSIYITATPIDPAHGYYYPEKQKDAYFIAHGQISVEPNPIIPIQNPTGFVLEMLNLEILAYGMDPFTAFVAVRHGALTLIVQAKRLNGRSRIFAKIIEILGQPVRMTHWARLIGWDAGTLIKRSGIDI
jgi:hypothetical protein